MSGTRKLSKIVVQKFGGTSVADEAARIRAVEFVREKIRDGFTPVLVVSAMGRRGYPYATDSLLDLAHSCGSNLSNREHDLIASCGEVISAVVMAQYLKASDIEAVPLTGAQAGLITDGKFSDCRIRSVDTKRITELLGSGQTPVIAGFQGVSIDGEVTTFGRGGSDTTACILGAALDADIVEIYTDVDGVMTADPQIVENANLIPEAHYSEIQALVRKGSRVITSEALEIASEARIPLAIRSSFTAGDGTLVHFRRRNAPVTGVASLSDITFFRIHSAEEKNHASNLGIFRQIADAQISVHFIDIRPSGINFVVESKWTRTVSTILESKDCRFETDDGFVKVSVVGVGMTGQPGMMATIVDALNDKNIPIYQSTDAQTSISCLIRKQHEALALRSLHDAFNLDGAD